MGLAKAIENGETVLGIEFGSTRIKAVLVTKDHVPVAAGSYDWENQYENHIWTYSLEAVWEGLQGAYAGLKEDVHSKYGVRLTHIGAVGLSGMMHGYLAFDGSGALLTPFRTWRNTTTQKAAEALTEELCYQIPQRWSIAHLYQAVLNKEEHVADVRYLTTLAGYVHWRLTGIKAVGIGEASGMFPIDTQAKDFHQGMLSQFDALIQAYGYPWKIREILPKVLTAGEEAGVLSPEGAKLLDPAGDLKAGSLMCPPEGDAGTGMAATNSIGARTGNVSAGTSVFAMIVLEKELSKVYPEIDLVTTPAGKLVGMVHCNNCTSEINAWASLFKEFAACIGEDMDPDRLFGLLYSKALEGDADCGSMMAYNYFSGETITGFEEGRPLFVRTPESRFNLANFMKTQLFTSLGALKIGLDLLLKEEGVKVDRIYGHGGFFKTKGAGQRVLAAALNAPVSVLDTAGEGGAWGIALLASYMLYKKQGETLDSYLQEHVFAGRQGEEMQPDPTQVESFDRFIERYKAGLPIERAAVDCLTV